MSFSQNPPLSLTARLVYRPINQALISNCWEKAVVPPYTSTNFIVPRVPLHFPRIFHCFHWFDLLGAAELLVCFQYPHSAHCTLLHTAHSTLDIPSYVAVTVLSHVGSSHGSSGHSVTVSPHGC